MTKWTEKDITERVDEQREATPMMMEVQMEKGLWNWRHLILQMKMRQPQFIMDLSDLLQSVHEMALSHF